MPTKENYVNAPAGAILTTGASSTDTSLVVNSTTSFPSTGQFRLICGGEIMIGSVTDSTHLAVTRGQEGTTAVTQASGLFVVPTLSDQALRNLCRQSVSGTNMAARRETNYIPGPGIGVSIADDSGTDSADVTISAPGFGAAVPSAPPSAGSLTVVNSASSFTTSNPAAGFLVLSEAGNSSSGENVRFAGVAAPGTTPYSFTVGLQFVTLPEGVSYAGVMFRESSTGKLTGMIINFNSANTSNTYPHIQVVNWSSPTATASTPYSAKAVDLAMVKFMRIKDDGTNLTFWISADGNTFVQILSVARGSYFTTAPNQVGLFVDGSGANTPIALTCNHWVLG